MATNRKAIWKIVKKFQTDRTVLNVNKGRSGQARGVRTPENIETVCLSAAQSPKKSGQRLSQGLRLSRMSTVYILKLDLKHFW